MGGWISEVSDQASTTPRSGQRRPVSDTGATSCKSLRIPSGGDCVSQITGRLLVVTVLDVGDNEVLCHRIVRNVRSLFEAGPWRRSSVKHGRSVHGLRTTWPNDNAIRPRHISFERVPNDRRAKHGVRWDEIDCVPNECLCLTASCLFGVCPKLQWLSRVFRTTSVGPSFPWPRSP